MLFSSTKYVIRFWDKEEIRFEFKNLDDTNPVLLEQLYEYRLNFENDIDFKIITLYEKFSCEQWIKYKGFIAKVFESVRNDDSIFNQKILKWIMHTVSLVL